MRADAWMVIGAREYRSVHLDQELAAQASVKHHGVIRDLVYVQDLQQALQEAYRQGYDDGKIAERNHGES